MKYLNFYLFNSLKRGNFRPRKIWIVFFLFSALFLNSSCSFFNSKGETGADPNDGNFKATVSKKENIVPLPIEVANDIYNISSGKRTQEKPKTLLTEEAKIAPRNLAVEEPPPITSDLDQKSVVVESLHEETLSKPNRQKNSLYKVRKGDTLMKISFEKYGDIRRWKEIYSSNQNLLNDFNQLSPGMTLKIFGVEYVVIEKNGQPYLIRKADTLAKISTALYGNSGQWKNLWKNNKQLIKNPNKIYAGFTLYYKPKEN